MNNSVTITKTARMLLTTSDSQSFILQNLLSKYREICNYISSVNINRRTNTYELHHLVYYDARSKSSLNADYVCQAIKTVASSYKSISARHTSITERINKASYNNNKINIKQSKTLFKLETAVPKYSKRNSITIPKQSCKINVDGIRLTTNFGAINVKYATNKYNNDQLTLLKNSVELGLAVLVFKHNKWYIHIPARIHVEMLPKNKTLGIDVGVTDLLALSSGIIHDRDKYNKLLTINTKTSNHIARLQANGSKSAKRRLKQTSGRRKHTTLDYLHCISKSLIKYCLDNEYHTICLEKLSAIRDLANLHNRGMLGQWTYRLVQEIITHKAITAGINVRYVNPHNTSVICSQCGQRGVRDGKLFSCSCVNHITDADINAAINISMR